MTIISYAVFHFHEVWSVFRFHELRHTYATLSLMAGDDIKTVQSNLGHQQATTTMEIYAHTTEKAKRESARRMEGVINNIESL